MYMYVVEKIGLVSQVGSLRELLKHIADKAEKPEYPKFLHGDTGNIPYREEFEMARELNKKMQDLQEVKKFGPRRHFKESEEESTVWNLPGLLWNLLGLLWNLLGSFVEPLGAFVEPPKGFCGTS